MLAGGGREGDCMCMCTWHVLGCAYINCVCTQVETANDRERACMWVYTLSMHTRLCVGTWPLSRHERVDMCGCGVYA